MSTVTTHVLDTMLGLPAAGVPVRLERAEGGEPLAQAVTDTDGRVRDFGPDALPPGTYRITFDTATYFAHSARPSFYPEVAITFQIDATPAAHYHVPLILSPFAYSTYRGS